MDPQEAPTRQAGPELLFGQIALLEGLVTEEQLAEAVEEQDTEGDPQQLGEILINKGYLIPAQLRQILEAQARRLSEHDGVTLDTLEESLFGKKAVRLGLATEQEVNAGLREHARRQGLGETVRLGQVLVETGSLTRSQVRRVLHRQRKEVLFCSACFVQYNIVGYEPGEVFRCKSCEGELEIPDPGQDGAPVDPETLVYDVASGFGTGGESGTFPDYTSRPSYSRSGEIEGESFGNYRILKKIARGGMGIVYQALQKNLNRVVALKVLMAGDGASEEELRRFHLEASAAANLNHPYIVPIHEVGEIDGRHYFTMDFVKGRTLSRMIRKGGLPIREALIVAKKVAEGLEYAHSQGIVHRDIKPANIILDQFGNPRITDFGIVKDLLSDQKVTKTGEVMGTPAYMSPEQATGEGNIDGRADVYSLGAVLYELLTSEPPFKGENSMEVLMKCLKQEPVSPKTLNPSLHRDVETICLKSLEKDPARRYDSAEELQRDIERYLNGETILARPVNWAEHLWRKILRHKAVSATAAAGLLAVMSVGGYAFAEKTRADAELRGAVKTHVNNGRGLVAAKEYAKAIEEFSRALTLDPGNWDAEYGERRAVLELETRHNDLITEGNRLMEEKVYGEAKKRYSQAYDVANSLQTATRAVAVEAASRGVDRANAALMAVKETKKKRLESAELLAGARDEIALAREAKGVSTGEQRKHYEEALRGVREAVWKDQESEPARKALFDLFLEFARAAVDWQSFDTASSFLGEARSMGLEDATLDEVEGLIDRARKVHEGYTDLMKTARDKLSKGEFDDAIAGLLQALEIAETEEARAALGQASYRKGIADGDRQALEGLFEEALVSYGMARGNTEDPNEVDPKIEGATKRYCEVLIGEANDFRTAGAMAEAEDSLSKVLELNPGHRMARAMLADLKGREKAPEGMLYISGGEFSLASDLSGKKQIVGSFYIDKYEVTNREYREFVGAGGYTEAERDLWDPEGWEHIAKFTSLDESPGPAAWSGGAYPDDVAEHPVTGISWYEERAYARWKGERLPYEWEWELAASGTGSGRRKYPWGEEASPGLSEVEEARPVGENENDESPFGVRDLGGNVNEWTHGGGDVPVVKGGSFIFPLERYSRCAFRGLPGPLYRFEGTGFRCVREIGLEEEEER